jgi:hypothetical protein
MEKKISPVDYLRLWIVGIIVLVAAFLLAFLLISCGDSQTTRVRKRLSRVTEGAVYLCRLESIEFLKA